MCTYSVENSGEEEGPVKVQVACLRLCCSNYWPPLLRIHSNFPTSHLHVALVSMCTTCTLQIADAFFSP